MQARVSLREQGSDDWPLTLFGSDSPATIHEVAAGKVQFAMINPGMILKLAALGSAPFSDADTAANHRCAAGVGSDGLRGQTGDRLEIDHRHSRPQVSRSKLSLRGQPDHSLQVIINHVCAAAGFTLDDVVSWGGEVRFDAGMPYGHNRIGAVHRGEIDAIFDEGASAWGNMALGVGHDVLGVAGSDSCNAWKRSDCGAA